MDIKLAVAENIRRIRIAKDMSIEQLSSSSGVSKSMLNQLERGDANPSITTVGKIALGLEVDFNTLTFLPKQDIELIRIKELPPTFETSDKVVSYPFFPYHKSRKFAIYHVEVEAGGIWSSHPHAERTAELIMVTAGELTVNIGDHTINVKADECLRFNADTTHSYSNLGSEMATLTMILY